LNVRRKPAQLTWLHPEQSPPSDMRRKAKMTLPDTGHATDIPVVPLHHDERSDSSVARMITGSIHNCPPGRSQLYLEIPEYARTLLPLFSKSLFYVCQRTDLIRYAGYGAHVASKTANSSRKLFQRMTATLAFRFLTNTTGKRHGKYCTRLYPLEFRTVAVN
jgi:hypothetical protein